jgi:uncharacterized RDD family membrane protein YckC
MNRPPAGAEEPRREFWPAAGLFVRLLAGILDLGWLVPLALVPQGLGSLAGAGRSPALFLLGGLLAAAALVAALARWQTTPGKLWFGLFVIRLDGRRLGWRRSLLRCCGYLLDLLTCGLGFVMIGLNVSRRGLHDLLAGTYVGRRQRRPLPLKQREPALPRERSSRRRHLQGEQPQPELPQPEQPGAVMISETTTDSGTLASSQVEAARVGSWSWRSVAGLLGGVVLGAVLLVGAWAKALDPSAFAEQIRQEGLDFVLSAGAVAAIAILLEVGLGTALVLNLRRLWVLVPAALLVVFFVFLTGRTYYLTSIGALEPAAGCGCFGSLVERTPAQAFWQDLLLLVPALLLAFLGRPRWRSLPLLRLALVAVLTLGMGAFAWASPRLPIDDLATRLGVGVRLDELCSGSDDARICLGTVWLPFEQGEHLVVIADLEAADVGPLVTGLNAHAERGHSVVVLWSGTPEQHRMFFWQWGPLFEIVEAPQPLLRSLYRSLPRTFRVDDGVVVATWAGLPPFIDTEAPIPEPLSFELSPAADAARIGSGDDHDAQPSTP